MPLNEELAKLLKDSRWTIAVFSGLVFSILMLVYKDLPNSRFKRDFVPAVGLFTLGVATVSQVQSNLAYAAINKQVADASKRSSNQYEGGAAQNSVEEKFEGLQPPNLHLVNVGYIVVFIMLSLYLFACRVGWLK